ncbi:metallophosphoesterase family protein [Solirubrobacter ginsenosidimutans]|uniref:Metallophosphoesterase family protein n=1 Tax=Solirubrobacter ginsenosidimutans TaxID=490573 RepID=A0A9X3MNI4_9ACTN|nr:fibronectin type III domain-containing protein [Solirubrobacter ginsenosidimutans]MDA0159846.1 metallophosphoesterase family protein [Solirubrobacter ginsenosidimutans]
MSKRGTHVKSDDDDVVDPGVTRRGALISGAFGVGGLMGAGRGFNAPAALAATTTTAPEQLHLEWGADPATEVTVSWSVGGAVPMAAPMLAYSTSPITAANPGALVFLPDPEPLDLKAPRTGPCVTSFTDGQSGQTTLHYHVPLTGLKPDTTYHYAVTDGGEDPTTVAASFKTAPTGRASFRFTAFGDQGNNAPSPYTTAGVANPGDGNGAPLFHLMVGDLAYADGNNPPPVWRQWLTMVSAASKSFPWMPVPGNHEVERGVTSLSGTPQTTGTSGSYYNGPYGSGGYFSRFLLPDNGLTNWDGNSLQGSFYSFQIGTVLFIGLAGNDVIWQTSDFSQTKPAQYTGALKADPSNMALVPDESGGKPNLQTQWLEQQLRAAREEGSGIEMIVVQMHFPAASVDTGNSCDMGARTAWGPLFDRYEVDLVLAGHNHNYCRSLPVRGYDPPSGVTTKALANPFGTYAAGATIDTRRPTVTQTEPIMHDGEQTWDTSRGTVHLVVGGGGAGSTIGETIDPATGLVQAHPFADASSNAQAVEDAPWLGFYDTANAYGYAVFDVDPGDGPGQTSITFQWFSMPSTGSPTPTTPLEKFVFARMSGQMTPGVAAIEGTVSVGRTVTADAGTWSLPSASLSYQWLLDGAPIGGATSETYTIAASGLGKQLQVRVTAAAEGYKTTTVTSAAAVVAGGTLSPAVVTLSGNVQVGGTVTAAATPWMPAASLAYQWLLNGSPISGATGISYRPVASDAGQVLEMQVTGTANGYAPASVTSVPVTVARGQAAAPALPAISGTPAVGRSVAVDAPTDGAYQWLLDGSPIDRATGASYTPVPADARRQLQVRLTSPSVSVVSEAVTVEAVEFQASHPGFRGKAAVGETLVAITGHWSPQPAFAYQWLLDGKPIKGKTHSTLDVTPAYHGKSLSLRVTAERTGYVTRELTSAAHAVRTGELKASAPRITGQARVGALLHVMHGDWEPRPEFSYRWYVDGRPVQPETDSSKLRRQQRGVTGVGYKVRRQDRGKRVTVEVTARAHGYETLVKTSAATAPVRA